MWDRKELKQRGMAAFKANYWRTVLVCFLLSFFVLGGSASIGGARKNLNITHVYNTPDVQSSQSGEITVNGTSYGSVADALEALDDLDFDDLELDELMSAGSQAFDSDSETGAAILAVVGAVIVLVVAIVLLLSSVLKIFVLNPLEAGCRNFLLRNATGESDLGDIGFGFTPDYWRNVKTLFLRDLFRFLWGLLLIVPGIIASYRYRMAIYLLIDHPEMSTVQCMRESARMMKGHKTELFVLDLSFIGWVLLAGIPGIGTVLQLWTIPYMNLVFCLYYEMLRGAPVLYGAVDSDDDNSYDSL